MSWAYAETCANLLVNQGYIEAGKRVWLLPYHLPIGRYLFTEARPRPGMAARKASVNVLPMLGARPYYPHGEGAL